MAINAIAAKQVSPTEKTAKALMHLLNYCATFPNAVVRYKASSMVLHIHSDASYMSAEEACSRAGGHFYLSAASADPKKEPAMQPPPNRPAHTVCEVICNMMSSATEAEIGALYVNTHKGEELRLALEEMGHPQPPTPVMTDYSMTCGIINKTVKQGCTRVIDMQFYWVRDCCTQNHFIVYWAPAENNLGDYHMKYHPTLHRKKMRRNYIHQELVANLSRLMGPAGLQGCVERILDWSRVQSQTRARPDGPKTKHDVSEPRSWPPVR
eukprot:15358432-Ditylum_brightwellii.AAC.1